QPPPPAEAPNFRLPHPRRDQAAASTRPHGITITCPRSRGNFRPHGKPYPGSSSAFPNYQRAEDLTEYTLNQNKARIEAWIKGPPPAADGDVEKFRTDAPNGEPSGRSVFKQPVDPSDPKSGYKEGGIDAEAYDVKGVEARLRYDSSRNPPFTVMTSMPYKS
ncbi:RNase A-like domain-containing protein, partial [Streptomyces sp. NPDC091278]|uniref:RNase A-like domain-containing protein n=1 Tax=Streptomyces sp. NPDC091278 TaxID=3155301 RepID=UPI00344CCDC0